MKKTTAMFVEHDTKPEDSHYTKGGIQPIDYITANSMGFLEGNVIKYVTRYKYKGKRLEDLRKAKFYIERLIAQEIDDDTETESVCFKRVKTSEF